MHAFQCPDSEIYEVARLPRIHLRTIMSYEVNCYFTSIAYGSLMVIDGRRVGRRRVEQHADVVMKYLRTATRHATKIIARFEREPSAAAAGRGRVQEPDCLLNCTKVIIKLRACTRAGHKKKIRE